MNGWSIPAPRVAVALLAIVGAAAALHAAPSGHALLAAARIVAAALVVAVVPGAAALLLWRARPGLTLLELFGYGAAFSFGVVQLLTVAALLTHTGAGTMLLLLVAASAATLLAVLRQRPAMVVIAGGDELLVSALIAVLAVVLYLQGAPSDFFEDQVHVAIVRRLAALEAPRLDTIYFTPGIVYTYPFPGTHYLMALMARMADIDALFLYHKLRFFWGVAAHVMLYLIARSVFGVPGIAAAVSVTAVVLAFNGSFAMVSGFPWGWGQLTPYSHASDVAMTVLLPALMAAALAYLVAESRRERTLLFTTTIMLVFMLTVVHIREIVQFAAYLGCFAVPAMFVRRFRPAAIRAALLLAVTIAITVAFVAWQQETASLVRDLTTDERNELAGIARNASLTTLLTTPAVELLPGLIQSFDQIFGGLLPLFLFGGPVVIVLFRHQPLVWLMAASVAVYLVVMTAPLAAIPYIYVTYYEILFTPVRNIVLFLYLIAGALLYVAALAVSRNDRYRVATLAAGVLLAVLALLTNLTVNRSGLGFFAPVIAAYMLTFVFLPRREDERRTGLTAIAGAAAVGCVALMALFPERTPPAPSASVNVRWAPDVSDAARIELEERFSLRNGRRTPDYTDEVKAWTYDLSDLSTANVRALVEEPAVADTHYIDRQTFHVAQQPPRVPDPFLAVEHVSALQYPGIVAAALTALSLGTAALFLPLALAVRGGPSPALQDALRAPFWRRAAGFAALLLPFALLSARPTLSPLALKPMPPAGRADTPAQMLAQIPCLSTGLMSARFAQDILGSTNLSIPDRPACPPTEAVMTWVADNVPADAVFATNRWNAYLLSVYMPQQVVVFPPLEGAIAQERVLFARYYELFDASVARYGVQPFFNDAETPEERMAFVESLGVTHIVIDPAYLDPVSKALDAMPDRFTRRLAADGWAVYEVNKRGNATPGAQGPA